LADHRVDPSSRNNLAIRWGIMEDRYDLVFALSRHPRVIETFDGDDIETYFQTSDHDPTSSFLIGLNCT
jgi:hypothetical protein